jgi:cyclophilin family peptidyl-prolyl cis-trans isomerase
MILAFQRCRPTWTGALLGLTLTAFLAACSGLGGSFTSASAGPPSAAAPATVAPATAECPASQPELLPAGETRTVTIETDLGAIAIRIEADLSPIAAGNFVALAGCGYYDGVVFHRVVPGFVIQGGDPTGTGTGGPGYEIRDEPVTAVYSRGTVAMARTAAPNSVGSQFFIVLDDAARPPLVSANTYQIIGTVSSGMETVDAITAAADQENPSNPVVMTRVTVSTP